jgi:hypothetical protein
MEVAHGYRDNGGAAVYYNRCAAERGIDMNSASPGFALGIAVLGLAWAGVAAAGRPSLDECYEGADFIGNAALSRDAGMSADAFLGRMQEDFVVIRAFPNDLRWFVHDPDDEAFLLGEARDVFDRPEPAANHKLAFLHSCVERMAPPAAEEEPRSVGAIPGSS